MSSGGPTRRQPEPRPGRPARGVCLAAVLIALVAIGAAQAQTSEPIDAEGQVQALLSLPKAVTNWDSATAGVTGAPWVAGTPPCGTNGSALAWRGVTCDPGGDVVEVRLPELGLAGKLPPGLSQLDSVQVLDLAGNQLGSSIPGAWLEAGTFRSLEHINLSGNPLAGTLPPELLVVSIGIRSIRLAGCKYTGALPSSWRSITLETLDISDNSLSYILPGEWGSKTALPALAELSLQGNKLRGPIPDPQWTSVGFDAPCWFDARPGNPDMCGPLLALLPQLYDETYLLNPALNVTFEKPQQGALGNVTTLIPTQAGLFSPDALVTITNTLGSCALPCTAVGGAGTATVETNFYDVTWQYNVSVADLLSLNPGGAKAAPGATLKLPCYPPDQGPVAATGLAPRYFGGDVGYLRFTGGNQRAGFAGLYGAMSASGTNDHPPYESDFDTPFEGCRGGPDGRAYDELVQPVFLFVDLQAAFQVSSVVLTAGNKDLTNASILVGSDATAVLANTRMAEGLSLGARQTQAFAVGGAVGRYVIVYTGDTSEGQMSVSDFQVYSAETNAAAQKTVAVSGTSSNTTSLLVDGNPATCLPIQAGNDGNTPWAAVDLGYHATVGSVSIAVGPSPANTRFRVYVKPSMLDASLSDAQQCGNAGTELPLEGGWASASCNATGRVVMVAVPATLELNLCEIQVSLTARPIAPGSHIKDPGADGSGGLSGGAIAGIVVASLAAVAVAATLLCCVWRRRKRRQEEEEELQKPNGSSGELGAGKAGLGVPGTTGGLPGTAAAGGTAKVPLAAIAAAAAVAGAAAVTSGAVGSNDSAKAAGSSFPTDAAATATATVSGGSSSAHLSGLADASATDLSKLPSGGFHDVDASEFELLRPIGQGSFGQVFAARYYETTVAVKMLTQKHAPSPASTLQSAELLRSLCREASLMSRLRHPNVCQYLGACADPPCLLMELCTKKSMDIILSGAATDPKVAKQLSWGRVLSMALDAAKGMVYLHSRAPPIAHRDLKSANLLVDSQWHVKVADFNLSRETGLESGSSLVAITNPRWLAPEVLSGQPGRLHGDVWAFGTVLWELATWRLPFDRMNPFQIITQVQSHPTSSGLDVPDPGDLPAGPFPGWPQYVELMQACWQRDPEARPKFEGVAQSLRALLAGELKRQQQLRQCEGGIASVDVPATSTAAVAAVAPTVAAGGVPLPFIPTLPSTAPPASGAVAARVGSGLGSGGSTEHNNNNNVNNNQSSSNRIPATSRDPERSLSQVLHDASPFAAVSGKQLDLSPPPGPADSLGY